jgi:hypothetical protein
MELVRRALGEEMVERIGPVWAGTNQLAFWYA